MTTALEQYSAVLPQSAMVAVKKLVACRIGSPSELRSFIAELREQHKRVRQEHSIATLRQRTNVDYDRLSIAFTYKYFASNYCVNRALLEYSFDDAFFASRTLIDIGMGSGASLLAHYDFLQSSHLGQPDSPAINVLGFDRSIAQISTASQILSATIGNSAERIILEAGNLASHSVESLRKRVLEADRPWIILSFFLGELAQSEALGHTRAILALIRTGHVKGVTIVELTEGCVDSVIERDSLDGLRVSEINLDGLKIDGVEQYSIEDVEPPKAITKAHGITISKG